MKIKSLLCSFVLGICGVIGIFGLSGCGDVTLETISSNFSKLEEVYASNSDVFKVGACEGMSTNYLITYGDKVDNFVKENQDGYVELLKKYNVALVISHDYIDNNKSYILNLTEEKLTKDSKKSFKNLNKSLIDYTESIGNFTRARKAFVDYFALFEGNLGDEANEAHLRKFKKAYGDLVSKNIALSMNLARSVETTEIFELLKNTAPTANDTKIMKEYIRAKMLPIYTEFMISEIENNLNWKGQAQTETKTRIDDLLSKLNASFDIYKGRFVNANETLNVLSGQQMNNLFNIVENFFVETDAYFKALKSLDISTLAVQFDNNLDSYKKTNPLADVYLEKLEQFVGVTLDNFITASIAIIY